jgi:uncharacterized protein YjgD (DUF1641 family)
MNKFGRLKSGSKKSNIGGEQIEQLEKLIELYRSEQIVVSLILDYIIEKFNIDKNDLDKFVKEKIANMLNNMNENVTQSEDIQQEDSVPTETVVEDESVESVKN